MSIKENFNNPRIDYSTKYNNPPAKSFETRNVNITFIKPLTPGQPGPNFPIDKICYCKNSEHLINECRKLAYRQSLQGSMGQPPGNNREINNVNNPGNAVRVSEIVGGSRDAGQTGRRLEMKIMRSQESTMSSPARINKIIKSSLTLVITLSSTNLTSKCMFMLDSGADVM